MTEEPNTSSGEQASAQQESATGAPVSSRTPAEQAAVDYASEHREVYGRRWRKRDLTYTVLNSETTDEGNTLVTMTYRPAVKFHGRPGEEEIVVSPDGEVVDRTQVHAPQDPFPWPLAGLALASVIAAAVMVPLILTQQSRSVNPLYVSGRILWMRVTKPTVVDKIQYRNQDVQGQIRDWEISPSKPNDALALVEVTLINQQSRNVVVVVDENAATLTAKDGTAYTPINTVQSSHVVSTLNEKYNQPGFVPLWQTKSIAAGEQLTGMLVFEVPKGSTFQEFDWNATDNMIVRYP